MIKRCEKCKEELRMRATIQESTDKGQVTFLNVPVTGCKSCGDEGYSMRNGLIIEHYAKFHAEDETTIDFERINPTYKDMTVLELMKLSNTEIQQEEIKQNNTSEETG